MSNWNDREFNKDMVVQNQTGFPFWQWLNGNPQRLDSPILQKGCWIFPKAGVGNTGIVLPYPTLKIMPQKGGEAYEAFVPDSLTVAILDTRWKWVDEGSTVTPGGWLQIAVLVKGLESLGLFCLSSHKTTSMSLSNWKGEPGCIQKYERGILSKAAAIAGKPLPRFFFWVTFKADPMTMAGEVGKQSPVTRPNIVIPQVFRDGEKEEVQKALDALYVGDEVASLCESLWPKVQAWKDEWKKDKEETPPPGALAEDEPKKWTAQDEFNAFVTECTELEYDNEDATAALGMDAIDWLEKNPTKGYETAIALIAARVGRSGTPDKFYRNVSLLWPQAYSTPELAKQYITNKGYAPLTNMTEEKAYWKIVWVKA